jgi:hypothetical protein
MQDCDGSFEDGPSPILVLFFAVVLGINNSKHRMIDKTLSDTFLKKIWAVALVKECPGLQFTPGRPRSFGFADILKKLPADINYLHHMHVLDLHAFLSGQSLR